MTGCRRECAHRRFVGDYRIERERAVVAREEATGGWPTEVAEAGPIVTFKRWLEGHAGAHDLVPEGSPTGSPNGEWDESVTDKEGW